MKKHSDIIEYIACIFFPNRCIFCGEVLAPESEALCDKCRDELPWIKGEECLYCGHAKNDCTCKKRHGQFYDGIASVFYFEDKVRDCIYRFKFGSDKYACRELAHLMSQTVSERYGDVHFDYVAYVPMDKKRQRKRGYNQSRLLAEYISDETGIPFADGMIVKLYSTEIQHERTGAERKGNLLGAFDINKSYDLNGKTVLIADDIKTSGATLSECGKMLYLRGADKVFCLTTAVVKSKINDSKKDGTEGKAC